MMAVWMTYALLVGTLVALGAVAVERAARIARVATRWVWGGAIAVAVGLSMRAPAGPIVPAARPSFGYDVPGAPAIAVSGAGWIATARAWAGQEARWLDVARGIRAVRASGLAHIADRYVVAAWAAMSAALLIVFIGVHGGLWRASRRWPSVDLHGARVLMASRAGPATIGLVRPAVILPAWLLARPDADQRMALTHELEHARAGDPRLLAAAWLAIVLFPWNAALWFIVARLRLAIEVDCDRRVIRRGAAPAAYGSLLLAVAERASPLRPSALALADDSSHLRTRILAMDARRRPWTRTRIVLATTAAAVALLAACEAKTPTAADIDAMSGASAEQAAHRLGLLQPRDTGVAFTVDGKTVSAEQARAVAASETAALTLERGAAGQRTISITTTEGAAGLTPRVPRTALQAEANVVAAVGRAAPARTGELSKTTKLAGDSTIVWFLNGVRVDDSTIGSLDRKDIERVEVIKGPTAEALYGLERGKGVVSIWTKTRDKL